MKEEFNLSENIQGNGNWGVEEWLKMKDVKEFIKKDSQLILDYVSGKIDINELWIERFKLIGEELTTEDEK